MVRIKSSNRMINPWIVDDGEYRNGRAVESVSTTGKVEIHTEAGWLVILDGYLSFVGNRAIIHPNPTPITKALNEVPLKGVDDGS